MRRVSLFIAAFWLFLIAVPQVQAQQFTWDENSLTDLSSMIELPNSEIKTKKMQYKSVAIVAAPTASSGYSPAASSPLYETSAIKLISSLSSGSSGIVSLPALMHANSSDNIMNVKTVTFFKMGSLPDPQDDESTDNPIGDATDYVPVGNPIIPMLIFVALGFAANIIFKKNGLVKKPL